MPPRFSISPSGEKQEWDGNRFNPYYEEMTDWYVTKSINGRVSSVLIEDVRHDRLTWITDY